MLPEERALVTCARSPISTWRALHPFVIRTLNPNVDLGLCMYTWDSFCHSSPLILWALVPHFGWRFEQPRIVDETFLWMKIDFITPAFMMSWRLISDGGLRNIDDTFEPFCGMKYGYASTNDCGISVGDRTVAKSTTSYLNSTATLCTEREIFCQKLCTLAPMYGRFGCHPDDPCHGLGGADDTYLRLHGRGVPKVNSQLYFCTVYYLL